MHTALVLFHVSTATIGLLSGFLSLALRKGSDMHRLAGTIFAVSMLGMSGSGAFIAAFVRPNNGNVMGGTLTFYLVATGWMAAKRRARAAGLFDFTAFCIAMALIATGVTWGVEATRSQAHLKDGYPAAMYFVFASIAFLFALSDVRLLLRGGVAGAQRLARHLWRMCLALLIATGSFYPGQAKLFSMAVRQTNFLYVPHIVLIGSMIFWMVRVRARKRASMVVPQVLEAAR